MTVQNTNAKKKRRITFAILYALSIALICFIFFSLWHGSSSVENQTLLQKRSVQDSEKINILNNDMKLHVSMQKIDELNMQYMKYLSDSSEKKSLDSLNQLISFAEDSMSNLLTGMTNYYTDSLNNEKSDSMIASYSTALHYRKMLATIRSSVALRDLKDLNSHDIELLKLKLDNVDKEDVIRDLQRRLQVIENKTGIQSSSLPATDNNQSARTIKNQRDSINILTALYHSASKDKNALSTQVKDLTANHKKETPSNSNQASNSGKQVDNLNARLILANVDCNLTRANAKDIIYTSKQRRELLQQSLKLLTDLSGSGDEEIKKLVKEKLAELKDIANNVHD